MNESWNPFRYPPGAIAKAIWAFILPGVTVIGASYARAASDSTAPVTKYDWIAAVAAMVITGGAAFGVKNTPPGEVTPAEAEAGAIGILAIVGILLIAVAILGLLGIINLTLVVCVILAIIGLVLLVVDWRRPW